MSQPDPATRFVTFRWGATPAALPAHEVTQILYSAVAGTLPRAIGPVRRAVVCGGELCAVLEPAETIDAERVFIAIVHPEGNVALHAHLPVDIQDGSYRSETGTIRVEGDVEVKLMRRAALLQQLARART